MIELCNEAQKDMWINIPAEATPQFVQSLAQLIDSKLDPNLNVYVEYGNEDWNYGFSAYTQIAAAALANPVLNQSLGQYQLVAQQAAYSLVNDGQIFDQVFGGGQRAGPADPGRAGRVGPVPDLRAAVHPAAVRAAVAVHLRDWRWPPTSASTGPITASTTLTSFFADIADFLTTYFVPTVTSNAAVAKQYGVPLVAYEGGESLAPRDQRPDLQPGDIRRRTTRGCTRSMSR